MKGYYDQRAYEKCVAEINEVLLGVDRLLMDAIGNLALHIASLPPQQRLTGKQRRELILTLLPEAFEITLGQKVDFE